jgi:hypothetical protein
MESIEILKIGDIVAGSIYLLDVDTISDDRKLIVSIAIDSLIEEIKTDFFYKTVPKSLNIKQEPRIGILDGIPTVGDSITINKYTWVTSTVQYIITNNIFITKNSVYLLIDKSMLRDDKLNKIL